MATAHSDTTHSLTHTWKKSNRHHRPILIIRCLTLTLRCLYKESRLVLFLLLPLFSSLLFSSQSPPPPPPRSAISFLGSSFAPLIHPPITNVQRDHHYYCYHYNNTLSLTPIMTSLKTRSLALLVILFSLFTTVLAQEGNPLPDGDVKVADPNNPGCKLSCP